MEFIISSYHLNVNLKQFFENAYALGIVNRYMFTYHGPSVGAENPHWHIWCEENNKSSRFLLTSIFGVGCSNCDIYSMVKYFRKDNNLVCSNFDLSEYAI